MAQQYKEFQGKTLDEAIKDACEYYGVSRSKLEIDIISDAKSGIFGLVGAKKATIRACRANFDDLTAKDSSEDTTEAKRPRSTQKQGRGTSSRGAGGQGAAGQNAASQGATGRDSSEQSAAARADSSSSASESSAAQNDSLEERPEAQTEESSGAASPRQSRQARQQGGQGGHSGQGGGRRGGNKGPREGGASAPAAFASDTGANGGTKGAKDSAKKGRGRRDSSGQKQPVAHAEAATADFSLDDDASSLRDDLPDMDLANCDQTQLFAAVEEVVLKLVSPIVGAVPCSVGLSGKRVRAELDCGEAAGILVGREGQTLASLQYLASRIVSRKLGASVHVQLDTGRYRERQEDRLRELALALAEKVKKTGRQQATRPLSAYQRRVVHLALEPDSAVQTKSSGDGPQRRVVIFLNKAARQELAGAVPEAQESQEDDS